VKSQFSSVTSVTFPFRIPYANYSVQVFGGDSDKLKFDSGGNEDEIEF
jgi:hypothetical protein